MMRQEALAKAVTLAGELDVQKQARLELLCGAAFSALEMRLREGLTPEDCREPFLTAVCLYSLAAMEDFGEVSEFKAGDLTVKKSRQGNMPRDLQHQAEALMRPYLKDRFLFAGV